jgi:hypothetical protein
MKSHWALSPPGSSTNVTVQKLSTFYTSEHTHTPSTQARATPTAAHTAWQARSTRPAAHTAAFICMSFLLSQNRNCSVTFFLHRTISTAPQCTFDKRKTKNREKDRVQNPPSLDRHRMTRFRNDRHNLFTYLCGIAFQAPRTAISNSSAD